MKHSKVLFVDEDTASPLHFFIRPSVEKTRIRPMIEHGGGIMAPKCTRDTLRLVEPGANILDADDNTLSTKYIIDCVEKNKLLDKIGYRVRRHDDHSRFQVKTSERNLKVRRDPYTLEEDKNILDYIIKKKRYNDIKGNLVWKCMEKSGLNGRTWQSLKERFLKKIFPNLRNYGLTKNELCHFNISSCSIAQETQSKTTSEDNMQKENVCTEDFKERDDWDIFRYIFRHLPHEDIKKDDMWKRMEMKKVTTHPWESMKRHFFKQMVPSIADYHLPMLEIKRLSTVIKLPTNAINKTECGENSSQSDESEIDHLGPSPKWKRKVMEESEPYTDTESKAILNFICKSFIYEDVEGNTLWRNMQKAEVTFRSWESMKDHYLHHILPNIHQYNLPHFHVKRLLCGRSISSDNNSEISNLSHSSKSLPFTNNVPCVALIRLPASLQQSPPSSGFISHPDPPQLLEGSSSHSSETMAMETAGTMPSSTSCNLQEGQPKDTNDDCSTEKSSTVSQKPQEEREKSNGNCSKAKSSNTRSPLKEEQNRSNEDHSMENSAIFQSPHKGGQKKPDGDGFSDRESWAILDCLLTRFDNADNHPLGDFMWKKMESLGMIPYTWQSMKYHYFHHIVPNINQYNLTKEAMQRLASLTMLQNFPSNKATSIEDQSSTASKGDNRNSDDNVSFSDNSQGRSPVQLKSLRRSLGVKLSGSPLKSSDVDSLDRELLKNTNVPFESDDALTFSKKDFSSQTSPRQQSPRAGPEEDSRPIMTSKRRRETSFYEPEVGAVDGPSPSKSSRSEESQESVGTSRHKRVPCDPPVNRKRSQVPRNSPSRPTMPQHCISTNSIVLIETAKDGVDHLLDEVAESLETENATMSDRLQDRLQKVYENLEHTKVVLYRALLSARVERIMSSNNIMSPNNLSSEDKLALYKFYKFYEG